MSRELRLILPGFTHAAPLLAGARTRQASQLDQEDAWRLQAHPDQTPERAADSPDFTAYGGAFEAGRFLPPWPPEVCTEMAMYEATTEGTRVGTPGADLVDEEVTDLLILQAVSRAGEQARRSAQFLTAVSRRLTERGGPGPAVAFLERAVARRDFRGTERSTTTGHSDHPTMERLIQRVVAWHLSEGLPPRLVRAVQERGIQTQACAALLGAYSEQGGVDPGGLQAPKAWLSEDRAARSTSAA